MAVMLQGEGLGTQCPEVGLDLAIVIDQEMAGRGASQSFLVFRRDSTGNSR